MSKRTVLRDRYAYRRVEEAGDNGAHVRSAVAYLESLELTEETETMWRTLGQMALEERLVAVAERSYAALGDLARARFLAHVIRLQEDAARATGQDGNDHYEVRARMAMLEKQFKLAENIYLEQVQPRRRISVSLHQRADKGNDVWDQVVRCTNADCDGTGYKYF
ncbi:hypothetical protein V5799_017623 [Amblyomma americanum]|uniref:Uncharacterized protein n=1 Tax=Amblyomma americanum TaxID=6943 RepID=A0AAQ4F2V0_AMBAM